MEQHIQRYTKYIHEMVRTMDIDTATYKDHLHKVFEWYGCIQLSRESGRVVLRWEDVPADVRELYSGLIGWRAFSTFWSACHTVFEDSEKILYRTAESTIHSLIQTSVQKGKLRDMTVTDAEFRSACRVIQKKRLTQTKAVEEAVVLRPYQMEAMAMMEKARDEGRNLLICLPTGTGKTVVTLQYHVVHQEKMLILVPTLVLMEQWSDACRKVGVEAYLIGTNQHRSLGEYAEQSVAICVYDSFGAIAGEVGRFGRIVVDEAHHVLVPERYMETEQEFEGSEIESESEGEWDEEEDESKKEERPISYLSQIRSLCETQRVVYLSATIDKPEDGSLYYEYKVRQAIQDGYLCDYEFVFPIFERAYETNQHLAEYLVHRQQETHCLVYASNRAEGREFVDQLNALQPGCAGYIDGTTRPTSRKKVFREFEAGTIRFLVNIRVLVEGFDAPHIRSVFFLRVSSSDIFIIQAIGRALRLHADKMKARVYVPFTHEGDIDRIQAFLTQLASYDERVGESIRGKRVGGYVRVERGEEDGEDGDEKGDEKEEVFEFRYNLVVDRMGVNEGLEAIHLKRAHEYKAFYEANGRRPKYNKKGVIAPEGHLARFFGWQKQAKNGKLKMRIYPSVETIFIDLFGEEWYTNRDLEQIQIKRVNEYILWVSNNDRHPVAKRSESSKESQHELKLAQFMMRLKGMKRGLVKRTLYSSVELLLVTSFGDKWYEKENIEMTHMARAKEYVQWVKLNNTYPAIKLHNKTEKENASEEALNETQLSVWMGRMKNKKTLYPSVETYLNDALGKSWANTLEQNQIDKAHEYISWVKENGKRPVLCLTEKKAKQNATNLQIIEHTLAQWLTVVKRAKEGKGRNIYYPSVGKLLDDTLGMSWANTLEQNQIDKAREYISWVREHSKRPVITKRGNMNSDQQIEYTHACWFSAMKSIKRRNGKGSTSKLYPSVEQILIDGIGSDWFN